MHQALDSAHEGPRHLLNLADATAFTGAVSSAWWWPLVDGYGHLALLALAIVGGVLRIAKLVRDLRRPR